MNYIHTVDTIATGYTLNFLNFIYFLSIIFAILVIISKNPVVSVLYLIGLFFNIACYLILLGISFVGLSYILVYVGAVSILFLFILMLINVRISELSTENTNSVPLILTIPILFSYSIQNLEDISITSTNLNTYYYNAYDNNILLNSLNILFYNLKNSDLYNKTDNITYVTSNSWDGYISPATHIASIGNIMYNNYSIWLLLTSIILLLSMVGTIVITLKK